MSSPIPYVDVLRKSSARTSEARSMEATNYLILSAIDEVNLNDINNGYIREFIRNGAHFLDFQTRYFQLGQRRAEEEILRNVRANSIDVVVYMAGCADFHFSLHFFKRLQDNVFTVMAIGDTHHFFDLRDIYYAQCMDLVAVYDCYSKYMYQQYGINAISFYSSYDKNKYYIISNTKRDIDISFVGRLVSHSVRLDNIEHIVKNGFDVGVYGAGSVNGQISLGRMVEIFNRTKINLNFNGIAARNLLSKKPRINARQRQMKGRMAEIALCGGFVLSDYAPGIEEVFRLDEEIVVFHSKDEMISKIKYYLQHEEEREEIARKGYVRALKDYEIAQAIPNLIERIEGYRKLKAPQSDQVILDAHFVKYYATFRVAMIVEFLKLRQWRNVWEEVALILKCRRLDWFLALKYFANIAPNVKRVLARAWRGISM